MKRHDMRLKNIWFTYVKHGVKTVEGRLYDVKRKQLNVGDEIVFINIDMEDNSNNTVVKRITKLEIFDNFESAINENNYIKIIPNVNNVGDAIDIYKSIYKNKNTKDKVILIYFE